MNDTLQMPDFSRKVYLFGKNKRGQTEMYEVDGRQEPPTKEEWDKLCDKTNAFTWSYRAWCWWNK